jgi:hypothetical protein
MSRKINSNDYKVHPVVAHLIDKLAEQPMIRIHFKKGTNKEVQRKLTEVFEKIRPKIETELILEMIAKSGVV